ncbi:hypothetical protein V8D89_009917 [Ganoderma adspersum]
MGDRVVHLSLHEFTNALLPVPQELISARFPLRNIAGITEAFADMAENHEGRAWDNDRYLHPEDQLAVEFTQIVNEHVLGHAAGRDASASQREGVMPSTSIAESTSSTTGAADTSPGEKGTSYVMRVFPHKWGPRDAEDVVRLLDNEPGEDSEDVDESDDEGGGAGEDEDEDEDDRRWSTAALFRREWQPELEDDQPNWAYQSAFVQFTRGGAHNDPFDFRALQELGEIAVDEIVTDNRERIRRQMQSYADNVALYQHRTAVFSLVVDPREFRVVRWDRSRAFVSERVDYVRDARALVEVLLALVVADHEGQGYDPTATLIPEGSEDHELMDRVVDESYWRVPVLPRAEGTPLPPTVPIQTHTTFVSDAAPGPADANLDGYLVDDTETGAATSRPVLEDDARFVFRYVLDCFRRSLRVDRGFLCYSLAVGGDEFLVAAPLYYYPANWGSPRGYVAFHKQSGRIVFLKDYWTSHYPGGAGTSEGDMLRRLNEDGVRNVPTLLFHGVVDGELSQALLDRWMSSKDQRTKSENIHEDTRDTALEDEPRGVKRTWDDLEQLPTPLMRHYVHYRIVLKEVCLPLTAATSSRQLVSVVGDCIEAHYDATEKSRMVHRNISSESIAILPTLSEHEDGDNHTPRVVWRGVLADWEFARTAQGHDASHGAESATLRFEPERTPTAQRHMSAAALTNVTSHVPTTADELESFFHIVLHHAIRFCPHNVNATDFISTTFVPNRDPAGPSDGADGVLCPVNKEIIVAELGVLKLRGRKVVFYHDQSGARRNAPLNRLLSTMLRWLKARYDLLEYDSESTATAPSSSTSALDDGGNLQSVKRPRVEPKIRASNDAVTATDGGRSASVSEENAVRPSDKTYELARRVDDHDAVRKLFEEALKSTDWPVNDVVEDQWIK